MTQPASQRFLSLFNTTAKPYGVQWIKDENRDGLPSEGELKPTDSYKKSDDWKKLEPRSRPSHLAALTTPVLAEMNDKWRAALKEAMKTKYLQPYRFEYNPTTLPGPIQQALPKFQKISELTEELRLLQLDGKMLDYRILFANSLASPEARTLFERGYNGGCNNFVEDLFCEPLGNFPDLDPNTTMWPDDIKTGEDLKRLIGHPQEKMLMSPFSTVYNLPGEEKVPLEKRRFEIIEYQKTPLYSRIKLIGALFDDIANIPGFAELEPEMAQTAKEIYKAIQTGTGPQPFDNAEIAWAKAKGRKIAFAWGPFEEAQDPHGIKRTFQFHLLLVREQESLQLEKFQEAVLQGMENRLADRVEGYISRNVSVPSVIQVYDVIGRSGAMNYSSGEYLAEVLPNTGPVTEGGYRKKMIFANLNEGTYQYVLKPLANLALDPDQLKYVDGRFLTLNSTLHELSHSIGPMPDAKVMRDGKTLTVQTAMGNSLYSAIEESKANLGGIWMYRFLKEKGFLTPDEEKSGYVTYVAGLMRQSRFGKKSPHGRGAKQELGYLFKVGAVEVIGPKIHVNLEKMPQAVEDLTVEIATAQNQGSETLAKAFFGYDSFIPEVWDKDFVPRFDAIPRHIKLEVVENRSLKVMEVKEGIKEEEPLQNGCGWRPGARR